MLGTADTRLLNTQQKLTCLESGKESGARRSTLHYVLVAGSAFVVLAKSAGDDGLQGITQ